MAETMLLKAGTVEISGFPKDIYENNVPQGKTIVNFVRDNYGPSANVSYDEVMKNMVDFSDRNTTGPPSENNRGALTTEQLMPKNMSNPTVDKAKKLISVFTQEAGPMALAAGVGFALGGPGVAAVLGLTGKAADMLNEKMDLNAHSSLDAGRALLEAAGVDGDPEDVWERIAAKAGMGVDETITMILGGQAFKAAGAAMKTATTAPKAVQTIGSGINKLGNLLTSKATTQIVGGAGSGAGSQGGLEVADMANMGPVGSLFMSLGGGILGDITATQATDIINFISNTAKASGNDMAIETKRFIDNAKAEGVDAVLDDFLPVGQVAKDKQVIREVYSGTQAIRGDVQNPQRIAAVRNIISEYGIDIADPKVKPILEKVTEDFNTSRGEFKDALNTRKWGVIKKLSSPDAPVPTNRTNALIEESLAKLEKENIPGNQAIEQKLREWQIRLSDIQNLPQQGASVLPQDKSLETIESIREAMGTGFKSPDGTVIDGSQKISNKLYGALREDMSDYVLKEGGEDASSTFESAMSGLEDLVKDLKNSSIKALTESENTSLDAIQAIIAQGDSDAMRILYKRLTPQGRANAQSAVIAQVVEDMMVKVPLSTTGERMFSPNTFADKVRKYGGENGVLFSGEDSAHLNGLAKVLDDTRRAEKGGLLQDVGVLEGMDDIQGVKRLVTGIVARNPLTTIPTLIMAKATKGTAYKMMEQQPFRDLLIKYNALPDKSRLAFEGTEILKRMAEMARGYFNAEADKETRNRGR